MGVAASPRPLRRLRVPSPYAVGALVVLVLALVLRFAYIDATPAYDLRYDARDYDRHAVSIAQGEGYSDKLAHGRSTAFRPPAYPFFLGGVYKLAGVERADVASRIRAARVANALLGVLVVALTGLVALQLWGRAVALAAMAIATVYVPLILVGAAVMSETLFVALLLGAVATALRARHADRRVAWAVAAGVLAGLMILSRANAIVLLLPLCAGVWRSRRELGAPVALLLAAALTVAPWTVRNALALDAFVPVSTQFGSALAGTYNDQARADERNPAAWRHIRRIPEYRDVWLGLHRTPEPAAERELRERALRYIGDHPLYVAEVGFYNSARMLELAGLDRSRHTASTISVERDWADAGVICFWIVAALTVAGLLTRRARAAPWFVWAIPALLFGSVIFLVVETPRYRSGIDPFLIIAAALALIAVKRGLRRGVSGRSLRA